MSVRHNQIEEVLRVIEKYVDPEKVAPLLAELRTTEAGRFNESFKTTIWRLLQARIGQGKK